MKFNDTIRDYVDKKVVAYRASAVISETATSAGEIDVSRYKKITFYLVYTKGTETGLTVTLKGLHTTGGAEHQLGIHLNTTGNMTQQLYTYLYTATANAIPLEVDVTGMKYIKLYEMKTGGTASGTLVAGYILSTAK